MNSQKKNAYITFSISILFQIVLFCLSNDLFHGGDGAGYEDLPLPLNLQRSDNSDDEDLPTFNVSLQRENATVHENNENPATQEDFNELERYIRNTSNEELSELKRVLEDEHNYRNIRKRFK